METVSTRRCLRIARAGNRTRLDLIDPARMTRRSLDYLNTVPALGGD